MITSVSPSRKGWTSTLDGELYHPDIRSGERTLCYGLTPTSSQALHSHFLTPAPLGSERQSEQVKVENSHVEIKTGKVKAWHTNNKNSLLPMGRQVFSHFQGSRAMEEWLGKTNANIPKIPHSHPSLPRFIYWAWCHTIWNVTLVSCGHLSCSCLLPTSHVPPVLPVWQYEKQERLYESPAQQLGKKKNLYIINHVFSTNLKHSPIPATVKKIASTPDNTSTPFNQ